MARATRPGEEHRLSAILFTDMVGSTALTAQDEGLGLRSRDRHRRIVREQPARFDGRLIEARGDETLSTFESALAAVSCGLAIQASLESDPELSLHVAVHMGEIIFRGDEVFGRSPRWLRRRRPHRRTRS
jgi:class 3 adenylate cyclase